MHSPHAGYPDLFLFIGACGGWLRKYQGIGPGTGYYSSHDSDAYDHCCDYNDDGRCEHNDAHHDDDHPANPDDHHLDDGATRPNCGRVRG